MNGILCVKNKIWKKNGKKNGYRHWDPVSACKACHFGGRGRESERERVSERERERASERERGKKRRRDRKRQERRRERETEERKCV